MVKREISTLDVGPMKMLKFEGRADLRKIESRIIMANWRVYLLLIDFLLHNKEIFLEALVV